MSFSSEVKKELSQAPFGDRYDRAAEMMAMILFGGEVIPGQNDVPEVCFHTENELTAGRFRSLARDMGVDVMEGDSPHTYFVPDDSGRITLLKRCGFMDNLGRIAREEEISESSLLQKNSCKRAFLRGAFLAAGSVTDPRKYYHFEITCGTKAMAELLQEQMDYFGLGGKIVRRKKYYIVYLKEGSMISDVLAVMSGHISKLNFENIRIYKDVRNIVNRRVNCETANISKTVSASKKQIEDIEYIKKTVGFGRLPEPLKEIACARLEDPSATLKELGQSLDHPVGKSGVNHRLRKLSELAQEIREKRENRNDCSV